jgi:hypothetical protein
VRLKSQSDLIKSYGSLPAIAHSMAQNEASLRLWLQTSPSGNSTRKSSCLPIVWLHWSQTTEPLSCASAVNTSTNPIFICSTLQRFYPLDHARRACLCVRAANRRPCSGAGERVNTAVVGAPSLHLAALPEFRNASRGRVGVLAQAQLEQKQSAFASTKIPSSCCAVVWDLLRGPGRTVN